MVYAADAGVALESVIIDSDHWRHGFLLLGLVWGLIAASYAYAAAAGLPLPALLCPTGKPRK